MNLKTDTFGKFQSGINLVKILNELDDPKTVKKISKEYHSYTRGIRLIFKDMDYSDIAHGVGRVWLNSSSERVMLLDIPLNVRAHLRNTMVSIFRVNIRKQNEYRQEDKKLRNKYRRKVAINGSGDYIKKEEWEKIREHIKEL